MLYKRNIRRKLIIYQITIAALAIVLVIAIRSRNVPYLVLFLVAYFIRDFIFSIHQIIIDQNYLEIKRLFLGGIINQALTIQRNDFLELANIDMGMPDDSVVDYKFGTGLPALGNSEPKQYEMYQVKYIDENGIERKIRIRLSETEVQLLG